jgi:hypothetical protein
MSLQGHKVALHERRFSCRLYGKAELNGLTFDSPMIKFGLDTIQWYPPFLAASFNMSS